jgi:GNAT acetyltransferase-like protein
VSTRLLSVAAPAPRDAWRLALRDEHALAFQTPQWLEAVCAFGGYQDATRHYELADGRELVLPLVRRTGAAAPFGVEASLPYGWGFGGLLASESLRRDDVAAVLRELRSRPVAQVSLRANPLLASPWEAARPQLLGIPRTAHVIDLAGGFDDVWKRFGGQTRNGVRKAEKSGVEVECDTSGRLVRVFYELYSRSVDRWANQSGEPLALARWRGRRRDPLRKFELVAQHLGEACRVWVAWKDGAAAAAIIVLVQGANASYWRGAMDKTLAGPTRANDLLQCRAIEDAVASGCSRYHMGESGGSVALSQFKERFGAQAHAYVEYRLERLPLTRARRALTVAGLGALRHLRSVRGLSDAVASGGSLASDASSS